MMWSLQVTLALSVLSVASCELWVARSDGKSLPHVHLDVDLRAKRLTESTMPIRIEPFYDSTVEQLTDQSKRNMIMNDIVPALISFLGQLLSVARSSGPILLNNQCSGNGTFYIFPQTGLIACQNECLPITRCGVSQVLTDHLKQCRQCDGREPQNCVTPTTGTPNQDGQGVANTDFILYVSANQSACPPVPDTGPTTVAFASHCQLEDSMDRPVAGGINFCPEGIARNGLGQISAVAKHELLHALGFSSSLYPYWRDASGDPRTSRNNAGQPPPMAGPSTIRTLVYPRWQTSTERVRHSVTALVTPSVVMAGRQHFGCDTLVGVELENQGGRGTALDHWEKRILGNEGMTGVFTFNPVFSNITLAALYDSGWYDVDFSMAEELVWGRGQGCEFVIDSCAERIGDQLQQNGENGVFPLCNTIGRFGCTVDRLSVAQCNLVASTPDPIDPDFQYFSDARSGGRLTVADYCPYYEAIEFTDRVPVCSDQANAPRSNSFLESYGESSRCLAHGREWFRGGAAVSNWGGGCYQYSCSRSSGVTITVNGQSYTCTCTGEEVIVDQMVSGVRHFGSYICPACEDICHDSLNQCPPTASDVCYGRTVDGSTGRVLAEVTNPPTSAAATVVVFSWLMLTLTIIAMATSTNAPN